MDARIDRRGWLGLAGGALLGYGLADPAPAGAEVSVKDAPFGAKGDGITNDTAAIQAALDGGGTITFPPGEYLITSTLVIRSEGTVLVGPMSPRSRFPPRAAALVAGAPIDLIRVSAGGARIDSLVIDGMYIGINGIVMHNSFRTRVQDCLIKRFNDDGIRFDTAAASPVGNNNLAIVAFTLCIENDRGLAVPVPQRDNNGLEVLNSEFVFNRSHGILYKGEGMRLIGGICGQNDGYGVQLSEPNDGGYTLGCVIFYPWLEANALGGVHSAGRSVRNTILLEWDVQDLTSDHGSEDMRVQTSNSGLGFAFSEMTGGLRLGNGSAVVRDTQGVTARWDIGLLAPGATATGTVPLPGARIGDVALATHTGLNVASGFLVSAYVYTPGSVSVSIRNETGAGQFIAGSLRILTLGLLV